MNILTEKGINAINERFESETHFTSFILGLFECDKDDERLKPFNDMLDPNQGLNDISYEIGRLTADTFRIEKVFRHYRRENDEPEIRLSLEAAYQVLQNKINAKIKKTLDEDTTYSEIAVDSEFFNGMHIPWCFTIYYDLKSAFENMCYDPTAVCMQACMRWYLHPDVHHVQKFDCLCDNYGGIKEIFTDESKDNVINLFSALWKQYESSRG
jgi:hypothetical protein